METMRTQEVTFNDLPWKINYTPERCTMCGSCVAACTFGAIEARIERRSMTISTLTPLTSETNMRLSSRSHVRQTATQELSRAQHCHWVTARRSPQLRHPRWPRRH